MTQRRRSSLGAIRVRDINDLLDELRAGGSGVDMHAATRGDARLAAAALAAYCRQLPEALLPMPEANYLCAALDVPDFALRIAGIRDLVATLPESNQAVLHRLCYFLSKPALRTQGEATRWHSWRSSGRRCSFRRAAERVRTRATAGPASTASPRFCSNTAAASSRALSRPSSCPSYHCPPPGRRGGGGGGGG